MKRDLIDPNLFGNEAGEDEEAEKLSEYFLEKTDFDRFYSDRVKLQFVRSRKGVGKSALLSYTHHKKELEQNDAIVLYLKGSDLTSLVPSTSLSPSDLIYLWQQRICSRINVEIGSRLKVALSDDNITLVESAELSGFRNRNLVSSLVDRFKLKAAGVSAERSRLTQTDSRQLLQRVSNRRNTTVWLFVDDIDATFVNTEEERIKTSTFFSSCRNLCNAVDGLYVRASVRTDVWTILALYDEALDKCEQYMLDLRWSNSESGQILQNKVLSYFRRAYPERRELHQWRPSVDKSRILGLVFGGKYPWGGVTVSPDVPVSSFSGKRPRWATQLCKMAATAAHSTNKSRISFGHIKSQLKTYGGFRLKDLYKEHRHQCADMNRIIEAFSGGPSRYSTEQLLARITKRIIQFQGMPNIEGDYGNMGSLSVAHFLYRIGFISLRDEEDCTGLGFVQFEDRPDLLRSEVNLDDGMDWEVHPSYRDALRMIK